MAEQLTIVEKNVFFLLRNLALGVEGTTVTATSQSPVGSMFVSNLLSPALDSPWRSDSLEVNAKNELQEFFRLRFDLGQPRTVNAVHLAGHNIRTPLRMTFYRQHPDGGSPSFVSPFTEPIVRGKIEDFEWQTMPWTLGPSSRKLLFWEETFALQSLIVADADYYGIRFVDVDIEARLEFLFLQEADYHQISAVTIGESYQPVVNFMDGWSLGIEDLSLTHQTESGSLRGRHRAKLKRFSFTLPHAGLPDRKRGRFEMFQTVLTEYASEKGKLGRVFAWPEPSQPVFFYDQAFTGTATELPTVAMANLDFPEATGFVITQTE